MCATNSSYADRRKKEALVRLDICAPASDCTGSAFIASPVVCGRPRRGAAWSCYARSATGSGGPDPS